jgi:chaperone protein EcpD
MKKTILILWLLFLSNTLFAEIVIDGTRVIYPAQKKSITINMHNDGKNASLMQIWMDQGDEKSNPSDIDTPFVINPSLVRVDPGKGQSVRVIHTPQDELPQDRESIFYINFLDIPPKAPINPDLPNSLSMAFKHRLKFFYRPLKVGSKPLNLTSDLEWSIYYKNNKLNLEAKNNSGYFITISDIKLNDNEKNYSIKGEMIGPFSSHVFEVNIDMNLIQNQKIKIDFGSINDFGGIDSESTELLLNK